MKRKLMMFWLATLGLAVAQVNADVIPVQAFFSGYRINDVAISPDGRYLSAIGNLSGRHVVIVIERGVKAEPKIVMSSEPKERMNPTWCGWANNTRLLCGFSGVGNDLGRVYAISRLAGVNADGSQLKVLNLAKNASKFNPDGTQPQFQDSIIDWTPRDPDTVLMLLEGDIERYPDVVAVNVYSGARKVVVPQHEHVRKFISDGDGNVRLGSGYREATMSYFARLVGETKWRQLAKVEAFTDSVFEPVAVIPGTNTAYAMKSHGDRNALWQIDLADQQAPKILFEHSTADIESALFSPTHKLIGVTYETDRPAVHYFDANFAAYAQLLDRALPNRVNRLIDMTPDERYFIVRSSSDVVPPEYFVLDTAKDNFSLQPIGSSYPGVQPQSLAPMRIINYPAQDGTSIPGYLTLPQGVAEQLPLIVMPHGGPWGRDSWGFDPWVQFLASRGYAVLQMNFRGSTGYGAEWRDAVRQDWGGLSYSDVKDATQWAIAQGIADPKRVCIVGASYGGYMALLGATRDSKLYRCAVSISGVSDLPEMIADNWFFTNAEMTRQFVGTDNAKLKADSPRRHVENVSVPILMIHGDHDYTVTFDQTRMMASALKSANKPFKVVKIEGADHYYSEDSDSRTLYTELESFLSEQLGSTGK